LTCEGISEYGLIPMLGICRVPGHSVYKGQVYAKGAIALCLSRAAIVLDVDRAKSNAVRAA